jgi:hypothetical protein
MLKLDGNLYQEDTAVKKCDVSSVAGHAPGQFGLPQPRVMTFVKKQFLLRRTFLTPCRF